MKHLLLTTIAAVLLVGYDTKNNMQWTNEKIEPAYALASDLGKATISEVYRVDDPYPNEQKVSTNLAPRSEKCEKIEKGSAREFTQSL